MKKQAASTEVATIKLRPTFSIPTRMQATEFVKKVKLQVANSPDEYSGRFTNEHAIVSIADSKAHFWSPCLNLEVRKLESGNEVFGRFSPHPTIWTGFMFSYLALAILMFFSMIIGWSQQLAAQSNWGFYLIPVWLLIGAVLWIASQVGQKLAMQEMRHMKELVADVVHSAN